MKRNPFKTLGIAALLLLAALGRPALAEDVRAEEAGDRVERARQLVAQLRAELKPVDDQIANAPFLTAVGRDRVALDSGRALAGGQCSSRSGERRGNARMGSGFGTRAHG